MFRPLFFAGFPDATPSGGPEPVWQLGAERCQEPVRPVSRARDHEVHRSQYNDPELSMSTFQKGAQGEVTTDLKYSTDGKPVGRTRRRPGVRRLGRRQAGDRIVARVPGNQLTQHEEWTLSVDGKTLTIATHVKLPNGEFDVKQVFEKAPAPSGRASRTTF